SVRSVGSYPRGLCARNDTISAIDEFYSRRPPLREYRRERFGISRRPTMVDRPMPLPQSERPPDGFDQIRAGKRHRILQHEPPRKSCRDTRGKRTARAMRRLRLDARALEEML